MKLTTDTFIISDTHFGDKLAMKKYPIRLKALNVSEFKSFDDLIVNRWNSVVGSEDSILHLGDLLFGSKGILERLNGNKILLIGNNDVGRCENLKSEYGWSVIKKIRFKIEEKDEYKRAMKKKWGAELKNPYATALIIDINNIRVMFSHFPVGERKRNDKYYKARDIIDYAYNLAGCEMNIHGHIHMRSSINDYCYNASSENLDFTPIRLKEILLSKYYIG